MGSRAHPANGLEYNREPIVISSRAVVPVQSFLETSDNVIVEALRREGCHIEVRLVECLGSAGMAKITMNLPHKSAVLTDLIGRKLSSLPTPSPYTFPVRAQQIVTLHFETTSTLADAEPVKSWNPFVPENKLPALHAYDASLIGPAVRRAVGEQNLSAGNVTHSSNTASGRSAENGHPIPTFLVVLLRSGPLNSEDHAEYVRSAVGPGSVTFPVGKVKKRKFRTDSARV